METPHPPYDAPADGILPRDPSSLALRGNVPLGGEDERRARRELAGYYAHVEATDRILGGLALRLLARPGPRPPPIVVFTSAHGDMHGSHGLFRKGWPHEESVRVPLLVAGAGVAPGRHEGAVSLLDLPGAARAWADAPDRLPAAICPARGADGSLLSMPEASALPHQCDRAWRAVRTPTRKLVCESDGRAWLFFDLEADPLERHNLAADPGRIGERRELAGRLPGFGGAVRGAPARTG